MRRTTGRPGRTFGGAPLRLTRELASRAARCCAVWAAGRRAHRHRCGAGPERAGQCFAVQWAPPRPLLSSSGQFDELETIRERAELGATSSSINCRRSVPRLPVLRLRRSHAGRPLTRPAACTRARDKWPSTRGVPTTVQQGSDALQISQPVLVWRRSRPKTPGSCGIWCAGLYGAVILPAPATWSGCGVPNARRTRTRFGPVGEPT
jgi:hypothetical protein